MKRALTTILLICLAATAMAQFKRVAFSKAQSNKAATGFPASNVIDGDASTVWQTGQIASYDPAILTLTLPERQRVDMVRYVPRQDGNPEGYWDEVEVQYSVSASGETDWVTFFDDKFDDGSQPAEFPIPKGVDIRRVRFTVRYGYYEKASAAEVEAYALDTEKSQLYQTYFSDDVYSVLRPEVTSSEGIDDPDVKALVDCMLAEGSDYGRFRVGQYEAYQPVYDLQRELGTKDPYNRWENPSGIYLKEGESMLVAVSGIADDPVGLTIKAWGYSEAETTYQLKNGINLITAQSEGNVFVDYYTPNYKHAPKVKLHFMAAPVRGYWDKDTMTNADWQQMLARQPKDYTIFIVRTEHAQLAFPLWHWKTYCPDDIELLTDIYEQIQWGQRDMLGLFRYGRQVRNRQLFYASDRKGIAADGSGSYCDMPYLGFIMKPSIENFDYWVVGHEWGHNNQIAYGFLWPGLGETSNNIYAAWCQLHAYGTELDLRLEDGKAGQGEYEKMRGGSIQTYLEEGVRKGVAWQLQDDPEWDASKQPPIEVDDYDYEGRYVGTTMAVKRSHSVFVKLVPFWQLCLWGTKAGKCPDIIPMVIESLRTTPGYLSTYATPGQQQVNWMKIACDSTGLNLLPFFERAGMLRPISEYIGDYTSGWVKINQGMIDQLKAHVCSKGYPEVGEEINYITAYNYPIYRDALPLTVPQTLGEGCTHSIADAKVTIDHSIVRNAVAYETYDVCNRLIRITVHGLGSERPHTSTQVLYPNERWEGDDTAAAYIMAVGYDGTRQKVYQSRTPMTAIAPLTLQQHTAPTYQLNGMPATQLTDGHIYITNNRKIIKQ